MSTEAIVWGLYGLATVVAVLAFRRFAERRGYTFDAIDGVIVALLWPFLITLGIFGELEEPEDDDDTERE